MMRASTTLLTLAALGGCWADFPPELLRPDLPRDGRAEQRTGDAKPDRPSDTRPADARRKLRVDLRREAGRDAPRDLPKVERPRDRAVERTSDAREAGVDLPPVGMLALGAPCTKPGDCSSRICDARAKVCCNASCGAKCMSCKVPGSEGRCSFVPQGADPHDDCATVDPQASCKLDGNCDGKGACAHHAAGLVVVAATCTGPAELTPATACDGNGGIVSPSKIDCSPYTCDPASSRCRESCASPAECLSVQCAAGRCGGKLHSLGASCTKKQDCASDSCVDGVCCDGSCSGSCARCDLPGMAGRCTNAFAGSDPDSECAGSGACGALDGWCNGAGACRITPNGTPCAQASCSAGALTLYGVCGATACTSTTASCGKYACDASGTGCFAACTSNVHCKPGCSCNQATAACEGC
jgi:hypothetical protein